MTKKITKVKFLGVEMLVDGVLNYDEVKKVGSENRKVARKFWVPKKNDKGEVVNVPYDYTGENAIRHYLFKNSVPRQYTGKESEKYLLEITTHPDILLRGMMDAVSSGTTIKRNSPLRVSAALSELPSMVKEELRTSSKPKENCDEGGNQKSDTSLFNVETGGERVQIFNIAVSIDELKFVNQDRDKGEVSFPVTDEATILNSLKNQHKKMGHDLKAEFNNYVRKEAVIPSPTRGVLFNDDYVKFQLLNIYKKTKNLSIVKATGMAEVKLIRKVELTYDDGSKVALSEDKFLEKLDSMEFVENYEKSTEELVGRMYSTKVAEEKKFKREEEKKNKVEEKKKKAA